jgi:hypothetical protein
MEIGIVGLPNVGKSTLFNALTSGHAASSNYPFTTLEPNVGVVAVPDPRLKRLAELFKPRKPISATVRFVDIAGLVKGASRGEGLGNKFLAHIREVDALAHLVRLFKDPDVAHAAEGVDPARDIGIIETELLLADLESVERQAEKLETKARTGDKKAASALAALGKLKAALSTGKPASASGLPASELKAFSLLTSKPVLFVGNTDEAPDPETLRRFEEAAAERGAGSLALCGKLEAEIAALPEDERGPFLAELGPAEPGLQRFIAAAYRLLGLHSFFTVGDVQVQGWTVPSGAKAPRAAGVIHTDFEKGFIRAEVYSFEDIDRYGAEAELRAKGLIRSEGRDYAVRDGDVCFFRFNA